MTDRLLRREFLSSAALVAAGAGFLAQPRSASAGVLAEGPWFEVSLAEWSLHKTIFGKKLDHLEFAKTAKEEFGIAAVEYVNQMFFDKAQDAGYLAEMKKRADDHGVQSLLIMCDREGRLGDPDAAARTKSVENHYKWADAAKTLGCHSIRVNAASEGEYGEQIKLAADGLRRLTEYAAKLELNVIVENHGGLSSNGAWLASVMEEVGHERCGTLPDFGNFRVSNAVTYDRYKGVMQLMPYAKAVSAKSHDFDGEGNETHTDYLRMMDIVRVAGYRGFVGIEYEGSKLDEYAGIKATKVLLERVRDQLAS